VALRQGDAVGLLTLTEERRWLAPRKGTGFIKTILHRVFDLEAAPRAFDPREAAEEIARRVTKRSLVILVTNLDADPARELEAVLSLAAHRHIVLLASLRERVLGDILTRSSTDPSTALTIAATHRYLADRAAAHRRLERTGIECLDVEPHLLPARLVNHYLALKSAGAL
jgi:uncharacterized protein (DUF58 family)